MKTVVLTILFVALLSALWFLYKDKPEAVGRKGGAVSRVLKYEFAPPLKKISPSPMRLPRTEGILRIEIQHSLDDKGNPCSRVAMLIEDYESHAVKWRSEALPIDGKTTISLPPALWSGTIQDRPSPAKP